MLTKSVFIKCFDKSWMILNSSTFMQMCSIVGFYVIIKEKVLFCYLFSLSSFILNFPFLNPFIDKYNHDGIQINKYILLTHVIIIFILISAFLCKLKKDIQKILIKHKN